MTYPHEPATIRRTRARTHGRLRTGPDDGSAAHTVTGVVDLTGTAAVIRAMTCLPSPDDVRVPTGLVRSSGLRRGDLVTGVTQPGRSPRTLARSRPSTAPTRPWPGKGRTSMT